MKTLRVLIPFFFSGLIFAVLSAGFDYSDDQDFRVWKFIFNLLFFGSLMGFFAWRDHRKKNKDAKKEE